MAMRAEAFWSAQAAFWRTVTERGRAKAQGYEPPASPAERKADLWSRRGAHYLRGEPHLPAGSVRVEVDPALHRDVARAAERLAPAMVAAFDRHLTDIAFRAWRDWPVSTGLSRALVGLQFIAMGEQYVGRVVSAAPYTYFIEGQPHRKIARAGKARLQQLGRDVLKAGHLDAGGA